jgi:hypothetical protein
MALPIRNYEFLFGNYCSSIVIDSLDPANLFKEAA